MSPQNSELVVIRPRASETEKEDVKVFLEGEDIVPGPSVKILGLTIQEDNKATKFNVDVHGRHVRKNLVQAFGSSVLLWVVCRGLSAIRATVP